ncbi:SRR1 family protein [Aspergillus affinis]|uniref:SRR1 family protein n=1 Tax=Aspergillus affinis TaxID=1070780 RepID=UPI0022FEAE8A|nr:uncharacterized protein KD926_005827 [Aspergillus affinis]KAI9045884.1 hypothetical protein KD926_005827 [Aspergillus affinis]
MSEKPTQSLSLDQDIDQDTLCRIQARLAHITQLWTAGKPFFPRTLLEDLNRQIDEGAEEVYINDLDDVSQKYSLKVPSWCSDFASSTYRINYSSIQHLGHLTPICPELALRNDHTPVSIVYARSVLLPYCSNLEQVRARFIQTRDLWLASSTYRDLNRIISTLPLNVPITKIVCFALGTLAPLDDLDSEGSVSLDNSSNASPISCSFAWHVTRAHVQHAAVETIRTALKNRGMLGPLGVKCYAQDPAYDTVDCEFLASIDITVLDDPKGFLEVDANTLVVSVSPNVPVRQIVADVQWPAAMVWNTVALVEKETEGWVKNVVENGKVRWLSPFTTDPDCARVRNMIKGYASATLDDANDFFGDMTIYMK